MSDYSFFGDSTMGSARFFLDGDYNIAVLMLFIFLEPFSILLESLSLDFPLLTVKSFTLILDISKPVS